MKTKNDKLLLNFMTEPFLEDISADCLYETRARLERMTEIFQSWNEKRLEVDDALYQIYLLFKPIILEELRKVKE